MQRVRSRAKAHQVVKVTDQYYTDPGTSQYVVFVNRETTIDEEHPWYLWRRVQKNPKSRGFTTGVEVGGDFTSVKTEVHLVNSQEQSLTAFLYQGKWLYNFVGALIPGFVVPASPIKSDVVVTAPMMPGVSVASIDAKTHSTLWPSVLDTDEELATLGASLVSKLAPTAPHNSVYTSLGELRNDGLPSVPFLSFLKKNGENIPQKVGGEYLNYQFGIAPTVSDVKSILKTIRDAEMLTRQYLRDSGRLVRRRMDMDPVVTTRTWVEPESFGSYPWYTKANHWGSRGPLQVTETARTKRWFSAAYLYYVDQKSLNGMEGWIKKSNYLYGWKPTLSSQYNLTPWSWLLDWFTNTGDVIDNISLYLEDPFLVRWAYMMEHQTITRTYSQLLVDNKGGEHLLEIQFSSNIKKRRRVNPFHLGFKGEELNAHQLSILAALGLTKGRDPGLM